MTLIDRILAAEELLAARIAHAIRHNPRQITAAVAVALLCTGGGAFAVASLGPDAANLPVKNIVEAVTPLPIETQVDALYSHQYTLFRSEITRSSDTAEALLTRLGVADAEAMAFVRVNPQARSALLSRPGRNVTAEVTQDNKLQRLAARWLPSEGSGFQRFVVERRGSDFLAFTEEDTLTPATRLASGVVRTTLFAATDKAGIPDAVASQLADIFSGEVDFHALHPGDRFAVVYETFEGDGQQRRTGRVLSAEFENEGKQFQALWFQEPGSKGGYYRPDGESLRHAYLRSPVEFSRISSGYTMRMHPILNIWRKHNGVDYAASTGTPVRSVGDGTVEFAGQQSGYGNIVIIQHRNSQSTAYAHLSRIDVKTGQSINQGQFIGAVGSTGWSTGPHLHFEFRVNGEYRDPATITQQEGGAPITAAARPAFERFAKASRTELAAAFSVAQASSAQ